jgi:hypothetical protein
VSRVAGQRLLTDRLLIVIVLVAHPGGLITEALDLVVSVRPSDVQLYEPGERA